MRVHDLGILCGVLLLHGAVVAASVLQSPEAVTPPALPAMQVSLVTEQAAPPRPRPVVELPPPPPAMPPPEQAIGDPPPQPVPPPVATAAPASPEPVVLPPRIDAAHGSAPPIVYPALSRRLGETGTVLLHLHVLADGRIGEVKVLRSSGFPRLDKAAADAALRWQLVPARRGDEPVAMWYQWPVKFELN
ncbi:MAG: energy transducer TonB [Pseudomonadota bacterium]